MLNWAASNDHVLITTGAICNDRLVKLGRVHPTLHDQNRRGNRLLRRQERVDAPGKDQY